MKSVGGIYLSWGSFAKVMIGCVFFDDAICECIVYDKPVIERLLQFFAQSVDYETVTSIVPNPKLTKEYFDGYLHNYSNGMLRIEKTRTYTNCPSEDDYKKFSNALFGKVSNWEELVLIKKTSSVSIDSEMSFEGIKTKRYKVIAGIYMGHEFNGHPIIINHEERIWDNGTTGNSYPAQNCVVV